MMGTPNNTDYIQYVLDELTEVMNVPANSYMSACNDDHLDTLSDYDDDEDDPSIDGSVNLAEDLPNGHEEEESIDGDDDVVESDTVVTEESVMLPKNIGLIPPIDSGRQDRSNNKQQENKDVCGGSRLSNENASASTSPDEEKAKEGKACAVTAPDEVKDDEEDETLLITKLMTTTIASDEDNNLLPVLPLTASDTPPNIVNIAEPRFPSEPHTLVCSVCETKQNDQLSGTRDVATIPARSKWIIVNLVKLYGLHHYNKIDVAQLLQPHEPFDRVFCYWSRSHIFRCDFTRPDPRIVFVPWSRFILLATRTKAMEFVKSPVPNKTLVVIGMIPEYENFLNAARENDKELILVGPHQSIPRKWKTRVTSYEYVVRESHSLPYFHDHAAQVSVLSTPAPLTSFDVNEVASSNETS